MLFPEVQTTDQEPEEESNRAGLLCSFHAVALELVGPLKGSGVKCPLLMNLKAGQIRHKCTTAPRSGVETIDPVHHSSVQGYLAHKKQPTPWTLQ